LPFIAIDVLYKRRYILYVAVLLGTCDLIQVGPHLGFYPKLEIIEKRPKLRISDATHVNYDIIKHFAAFVNKIYFYPNLA